MNYLILAALALGGFASAVSPADAVRSWVSQTGAVRQYSQQCQIYNGLIEKSLYPATPTSKTKFIEGQRYTLDTSPSTSKTMIDLYATLNGFTAFDVWTAADNGGFLNTYTNAGTPRYAYNVALFKVDGEYGSSTAMCLVIAVVR